MIPKLPDSKSGFWTDNTIFENSTGTILDGIHRGIQGNKDDKLRLMLLYRMYLTSEQFTQLILLYFSHIAGNSQLEELWIEFVEMWILNCFHCDFTRSVRSTISAALNALKSYQPEAAKKLIKIVKCQKLQLAAVAKKFKQSDTCLNFNDWVHDAAKSPHLVLDKAHLQLNVYDSGSDSEEEDNARGSFSSRLSSYFKRLSVLPTINSGDMQDVEWLLLYPSDKIARHLFVIEYEQFVKIPFTGLLNAPVAIQPYKKRESVVESNLGLFVDRFNRICQLVSSSIYNSKSNKLVRKFVHVAAYSYKMNNCMTLMAIMLGLQSPHLDSLEVFDKLTKEDMETFQKLKMLCTPLNNFKSLRAYTEKIVGDKNAIPFVGLYVSDIVFMKEVDSYLSEPTCTVGQGYEIPSLNLRKYGILGDRICEFYKFQEKDCIEMDADEILEEICRKL